MKYGLLMFSTDYAIHPAELARAAEERTFESLLFPEHTHIPASRQSPWPGGPALPEEASYHGEHVDFDPIWSWPKPVHKPHPPILLGTGSARGRQRVIDYCDGWMPIAGRDDVSAGIVDLRARAEAAGRDPASISITIFGAPGNHERIAEYQKLGVERVVSALPPEGRDAVLPVLDRYAALIRSLEG